MAVQSGFTKDDVSMTFTGSLTSEDSGVGFGPGGTPSTPSTFEIRWNDTTASLEYRNSPDATWLSLVTFRRYNV